MDLLEAFKQHLQEHWPGLADQKVLLAVSGGMDSMVMADLFLRVHIPFGLAHCNFQLRDKESEADQQLVSDWAAQHSIPFHVTRFDTQTESTQRKQGIQEVARELRYAWLESVRAEHGYSLIATAHHAQDNAETVLFNLFRGTGISGLHGIRLKQKKLIRPLMFAAKDQVRSWAASQVVPYRDDSSNASDKYKRNAIRLNILPVVEQHFPGVVERINESIHRLSEAEILYQEAVTQRLKKLEQIRGKDVYIPVRKLLKQEPLNTVCYELFRKYGFGTAQVQQLLQLTTAPAGKFIENERYRVVKDREFLIITSSSSEDTDFHLVPRIPSTIEVSDGRFRFSRSTNLTISSNPDIACLDADSVELPLVLRRWRTGDYFYPLGMGMKKKKLSRFFIDQKIALPAKERLWILTSGKKIVWISGLRLDERFKVTDKTRKVLKVEWLPVRVPNN